MSMIHEINQTVHFDDASTHKLAGGNKIDLQGLSTMLTLEAPTS